MQDVGIRSINQSFNVLVRQMLPHEPALVSRCAFIKMFDATRASVRPNSPVNTVNFNKHTFSMVFPADALHLFTEVFLLLLFFWGNMIPRESKNLVYLVYSISL